MSLYETLRTDILQGVFDPGSKLRMETLKSRYNSGVNVLRESLARLSIEGFVESEDQKGFRIACLSIERLRELTQLRILFECEAIRLSLENGGVEWESNLVAAHHKLSYMGSKMREDQEACFHLWHESDYEFHAALIAACGSALHKHYHRQIYDQFRQYVVAEIKAQGFRGEDIVDEHGMIVDAALKGDAQACCNALKIHLEGFYQRAKQHSAEK